MALVFYAANVPAALLALHEALGSRDLARHMATVHDGELRVQSAREPLDVSGRLFTHVSVTVGKPGGLQPHRRPTDEEMRAVREGLFSLVEFEEDNGDDPNIRHLWEISK